MEFQLNTIIWRIDDPNCSQIKHLFLNIPVSLSNDMIAILKEPLRFQSNIPISKIILYFTPSEDITILDRIEIIADPKTNGAKYLTTVDLFMMMSQYYNTPLQLQDVQRLANLGSIKARSLLNSDGNFVSSNNSGPIIRRTLMGSYINYKGLKKYLDGYLVCLDN